MVFMSSTSLPRICQAERYVALASRARIGDASAEPASVLRCGLVALEVVALAPATRNDDASSASGRVTRSVHHGSCAVVVAAIAVVP